MGRSVLASGLFLFLMSGSPGDSDESSIPLPPWQQLLEMAATELDGGADLPPFNGIQLLMAVGRYDEAVDFASSRQGAIFQQVDAGTIVEVLVRFNQEPKLDDPRLKAILQPNDIAMFRTKGLIRRGDLDEAEKQLNALSSTHQHLITIIEELLRLCDRRAANQQTGELARSLRLTIDCISRESERKLTLYPRLKQLEQCSELVSRNQLPELMPLVLANADAAYAMLRSDASTPDLRGQYYSKLAAIFFYCEKPKQADEQLKLAAECVDAALKEIRESNNADSTPSARHQSTAEELLETTGRIAALLSNLGRTDEARKRIETTKSEVKRVFPDKDFHDDWTIVKLLIHYGALDLAQEFIAAARSPYWRCQFEIELCEELTKINRRDDALTRLRSVIPQISLNTEPVNRFGLQSDVIRLLSALKEKQLSSQVLGEVLDENQQSEDPRSLQSVFFLLINVHEHERAWKLFQEHELAGSKAWNLTTLGLSLRDAQIAKSGKAIP